MKKDSFYYQNFAECDASNEAQDAVLAYRLWEISESLLIDRTNSFDSYLMYGDQFSSYTKEVETKATLKSTSSIDSSNNSV